MKRIILLLSVFVSAQLCADWLIETTELGSGNEHCPDGGVLVSLGEDSNPDGVLDENDELLPPVYICNGKNGCDTVFKIQAAESCQTNYGVVVKSGLDCDSDGNIDSGKETEVELCYGESKGNGVDATEGTVAFDGPEGSAGRASELVVTEEPAGEHCAAGGTKIENRFDANENGEFEESEIVVKYICNGESPQGSQGEQGNQGIAGTDGKDGAQGAKGERGDKGETGEAGIDGEPGEDGADGYDSLLSVVDEPAGDNCANGGKKFLSGIDTDRNGVLDESEVKNSYYICNGEDAVEASEQAASSGCAVSLIDDNSGFESFYSAVLNVCRFVSDLF